ncbi:S-adenosyl-l-methionine hydroxide adenosyltransferase family protein [Chloroflexota bacterium]
MSRPVIALTTDFGQADGYVGIMKGVILGICPQAALVDVCHEVRPQAVRQAGYVLKSAVPYFPFGTVHVVVVDPGVGSERRPIVVQTERAVYVAPDNGVLSLTLTQDAPHFAVQLTDPHYQMTPVSATFHGRDIFAPAAAHLACGVDPREMGDEIAPSKLVGLPELQPVRQPEGSWLGEVLHIDRFGNLVTSFSGTRIRAGCSVHLGGESIPGLSRTYADVGPGELVAYVGSSGQMEVAVRGGSAATKLGVNVGTPVQVRDASGRFRAPRLP